MIYRLRSSRVKKQLKLSARSEEVTTRQQLSVRVLGNVDAVHTLVAAPESLPKDAIRNAWWPS